MASSTRPAPIPAAGDSDVTLIGLDVTFRGHPENTFRLLANSIYNGLD